MSVILLREVQEKDVRALERLAEIPGFINLPQDREALQQKIEHSMVSFAGKLKNRRDAKFIFVAEDVETGEVVATSMIAAQHGTEKSPHFYFQVDKEEKYSDAIGTGFIHGTLELKADTNGPSEIGGLVVDPAWRNKPAKVGKQISFVRFLFLGTHRELFRDKILAELLPPLNKKGHSPLWEAIGRRFTNMDYWEADQLCNSSKEFVYSLFPSGKTYTTFLSAEAKNAIGKVGKSTQAVVHMLKKIGFRYLNHVDPFDGGPHYWAEVDQLVPLQRMRREAFQGFMAPTENQEGEEGLLSRAEHAAGQFRAFHSVGKTDGGIWAVDSGKNPLNLKKGDQVIWMPYY